MTSYTSSTDSTLAFSGSEFAIQNSPCECAPFSSLPNKPNFLIAVTIVFVVKGLPFLFSPVKATRPLREDSSFTRYHCSAFNACSISLTFGEPHFKVESNSMIIF